MRHVIALLFFFIPFIAFAQTKADYQKVMGQFVKFYNNKQGDEIVNLFEAKYRNDIRHMWTPKEMEKLQGQYGQIKSFKYIGKSPKDPEATIFTTIFSKLEPK